MFTGKEALETGPPTSIERVENLGCPSCGSEWLFSIQAPVINALLSSFTGVSNYMGCPACGWRSQAMTAATKASESTADDILRNIEERLKVLEKYRKSLIDLHDTVKQIGLLDDDLH